MNSSIGLQFLRDNGARRAASYGDAPDFRVAAGTANAEEDTEEEATLVRSRDWDYEHPQNAWAPIPVLAAASLVGTDLNPQKFVDGKEVGRTVAYIASPQGFPVPVRLAQVGAVSLRSVTGSGGAQHLRCETRKVDKVVALMADLFPWEEIEAFAVALHANGYRLLISRRMGDEDDPRDLGWLNENARSRVREEMFRLERQAISPSPHTSIPPTIADGRLDDKNEAIASNLEAPVFGLIKSHHNTSFLHDRGWQTLYQLRPGERTPILSFQDEHLSLLTWYLRLCPGDGSPLDGIVRIEVMRPFFERAVGGDFCFCNSLSRMLCESRTRDGNYGRASTTLIPIQRAEDSLRARFQAGETLLSRFYHLTGL